MLRSFFYCEIVSRIPMNGSMQKFRAVQNISHFPKLGIYYSRLDVGKQVEFYFGDRSIYFLWIPDNELKLVSEAGSSPDAATAILQRARHAARTEDATRPQHPSSR